MNTHQEAVKKRLGTLITEGYTSAGITRGALSAAVGLSTRSLFDIEKGQSVPRKASQERIEEFFGWKRGAIAELLSAGPGVDLDQVTQRTMRAVASAEWLAEAPAELDETARRIQEDAEALSLRLRAKDRTIASLEDELRVVRARVDWLERELLESRMGVVRPSRGEVTLAADDSPNRGAVLRDMLDEVAEGNQDVEGEK